MKVLVVHNRYRSASPSGEDRVVDQETAALAAAGHVVERFERFSDDIASWSAARKALLPARVVWSDEARRSLRRVLRGLRPDVVHVHNTFPLLSPAVLYACRSERVPVVVTLHNYSLVCANGVLFRDGATCHDCVGRLPLPGVRHGCYRSSVAATVPLATSLAAHRRAWRTMVSAYIFISAAQRDILATDGFPADRLFVKHNFVEPRSARDADADAEDVVVYAGRLTPAKGIRLLMEAWDRHLRTMPDGPLRLVVAGAGPLQDEVAAWATSRSSVEWRGLLDPVACAALMARSRACVVPSQWEEPFGLVVAESMAAGVPSIAPAHGAFPELITDGVDGVLFPPGDTAALAAVFDDMASRPDRYGALGAAARTTFAARFSVDANVEELLGIYRFAISNAVGSVRVG